MNIGRPWGRIRGLTVPLGVLALLIAAPGAFAAVPANDVPANAEVLSDASMPILSSTVDITDAGDVGDPPAPSCTLGGGPVDRGVWFRISPSVSRDVRISSAAEGPSATTVDDTVLAIYTSPGGAAGPFTEVPTEGIFTAMDGCDDDGAAVEPSQSTLRTNIRRGTEYWIVVFRYSLGGVDPANADVQLRIEDVVPPVANDTGATALELRLNKPVPQSAYGTADNDYTLPPASTCFTGLNQTASPAAGNDLVYRFTAPSAGEYGFRLRPGGNANSVLHVASSLPAPSPTPQDVSACLGASNRGSGGQAVEEVSPLTLAAGQTVLVVVDQHGPVRTGVFNLVAERIQGETEPNDTPATADPTSCGLRGASSVAGDVDFFSLGSPAVGSRVFALGIAGAGAGDIDMRVTTATDTLEYDDNDGNNFFPGTTIAGTPLTGAASFLRINQFAPADVGEPYLLYSVVQPPPAAATVEAEPNDSLAEANSSAVNYAQGTVSAVADSDFYAVHLPARTVVFAAVDGDPLRNNTPMDPTLTLIDPAGTQIFLVDRFFPTSNTTSGVGSLTATTPFSPAEGLVYRTPVAGTYFVKVGAHNSATTGDYLLSMSAGCAAGAAPELKLDPATLPDTPVAVRYEQTLTASGGAPPYSFELLSGALPPGITLDPNGEFGGEPSVAGTSTFKVEATDSNDRTGEHEYALTVKGPPDTQILTGPANGSTSGREAAFTFEGTPSADVDHLECKLDTEPGFTTCTSPLELSGLSGGARTLLIRAVGHFEDPDDPPASRTWTVDATPPDTQILTGPANGSTSAGNDPTFTFNGTPGADVDHFACKLDTEPAFTTCTSPRSFTDVADGARTFSVRAIDAVGNVDPSSDSRTWTVDTAPPDTEILTGPANGSASASNDPSFTFNGNPGADVDHFECKLDTEPAFTLCTSPRSFTDVADGSRTFQVRAIDAVGNVDLSPRSRTWTVDTISPDTQILTGPANASTSADNDPIFTFAGSPGADVDRFECKLDTEPAFTSCTSPRALTNVADGTRTFAVRAVDALGNADQSPDSRTWILNTGTGTGTGTGTPAADTTPPQTTIVSGPKKKTTKTKVVFEFSSSEAGSAFECAIDKNGFAACASPLKTKKLKPGKHTFSVRGTDAAGNADATPATQSFKVTKKKLKAERLVAQFLDRTLELGFLLGVFGATGEIR